MTAGTGLLSGSYKYPLVPTVYVDLTFIQSIYGMLPTMPRGVDRQTTVRVRGRIQSEDSGGPPTNQLQAAFGCDPRLALLDPSRTRVFVVLEVGFERQHV